MQRVAARRMTITKLSVSDNYFLRIDETPLSAYFHAMKRTGYAIAAALAALSMSAPAHAMTYFLVSQWYEGGNQFCKYGNGTILNVGYKVCPLSIEGAP